MSGPSRHAFIDESRRAHGDGFLYLMAAVEVPATELVALARDLRVLLPSGARSLHFRHDRDGLRRRHLELIAERMAAGYLRAHVAVASIQHARHERRARVRCLSALAAHLADAGVGRMIIESRQEHDNRVDDRVLLDCRRDGLLAGALVWAHHRYTDDELLWIADAVAGVVGLAAVGRDRTNLAAILPSFGIIEVWRGSV